MSKKTIPKVIFKFDKEKDLENIWKTCNTKQYDYGAGFKELVTKNILHICEGKKFKDCKKELEETMSHIYKNPIVEVIVKSFNESWKKVDKEYFKRLERIMHTSLKINEIPVYLTNSPMCVYDPRKNSASFFTHFYGNISWTINVAMHELMHIYFHNSKYWKICEREIGRRKTFDLKEALTVLLNSEFNDLMINEDEGYEIHKELRKYIFKEWEKEKDFDSLIDKSIKWIKKNN
jgi:hypothetical protein